MRIRSANAGLVVVAALMLAGCAMPTPPATGSAATPEPTEVPGAVEVIERPPGAYLTPGAGSPPGVAGEEGTFVWDGLGADAPWIEPRAVADSGSGPWTVSFDPPLPAGAWTAQWGRYGTGVPAKPGLAEAGLGDPVSVSAPRTPGRWTLQVEVAFGEGRHALWYWQLDVRP